MGIFPRKVPCSWRCGMRYGHLYVVRVLRPQRSFDESCRVLRLRFSWEGLRRRCIVRERWVTARPHRNRNGILAILLIPLSISQIPWRRTTARSSLVFSSHAFVNINHKRKQHIRGGVRCYKCMVTPFTYCECFVLESEYSAMPFNVGFRIS